MQAIDIDKSESSLIDPSDDVMKAYMEVRELTERWKKVLDAEGVNSPNEQTAWEAVLAAKLYLHTLKYGPKDKECA